MDSKESLLQENTTPTVEPKGLVSGKRPWTFTLFLSAFLVFLISLFVLFSNLNTGFNNEVKPIAAEPTPMPLFLSMANIKGSLTAVNGEILISGKTLPYTTVIIYSDIDETSLESNAGGTFEETLKVGEEGGLVRVSAFAENGEEKSETLMIQKSEDVLGNSDKVTGKDKKEENSPTAKANQNSQSVKVKTTPSAVQTKVALETEKKVNQQKINKFLEDEVALPAAVKKIGSAKIKEILATESTEGAKLKNNLKLQKMVATEASATATLKRHAVFGVVIAVSDGTITIAHQIQRDRIYQIYFNENTLITSKDGITTLAVGMRIVAVGEPVGGDLLAKRIHIIPGKATGVFSKQPTSTESGTPTATSSPTITIMPTIDLTFTPSPETTATPTLEPTNTPVPEATVTPTL